ncbi:Uncharacterised protein [Vibrio cholerae]|nr:Uncharacterised protein [Vibrio cholerae]
MLYFVDVFADRKFGAIGDAKDVRIDRNSRPAKGCIQHHIGGFTPNAWQRF